MAAWDLDFILKFIVPIISAFIVVSPPFASVIGKVIIAIKRVGSDRFHWKYSSYYGKENATFYGSFFVVLTIAMVFMALGAWHILKGQVMPFPSIFMGVVSLELLALILSRSHKVFKKEWVKKLFQNLDHDETYMVLFLLAIIEITVFFVNIDSFSSFLISFPLLFFLLLLLFSSFAFAVSEKMPRIKITFNEQGRKTFGKGSAEYDFLDETERQFILYDISANRNVLINKDYAVKAEVYTKK